MPKIPKILHYFYDDIDIFKKGVKPHFRMCYMSWIRACEGYEIRLVSDKSDEFSQMLKNSRFLREVYKRKIWALVSDYVRYFVLFHNGGIYLDTDVELLGNFDAFLDEGAFCSVEGDLYKNENVLESAVIGGLKGHIFFKKMLEIYDSGEIFRLNEIYANAVAWHCLNKNGGFKMIDYPPNLAQKARDFYAQNNQMRDFELYKAQQITKIPLLNMSIYPARFFCPSWNFFGAKAIAPETISIHHNQSSWWAHKKPLRRILATRYKNPLKKFLFINTDKIAKICTFLIPNKKTRVKTRDKIKEFILNFVRI